MTSRLASPDEEMLTLADGSVVFADGTVKRPGQPDPGVAVPSNSEAQRIVAQTRRTVADLPVVPARMNGVAVILAYTMYGMDPEQIAIATGISTQQVITIRESEPYKHLQGALVSSVVEADGEDVRSIIALGARTAAHRLIDLMGHDDGRVAVAATNSILDRAGHRPADVVEHRHKMEGTLVIEHIKKDQTSAGTLIDIAGASDVL